jgi:hypothetical protein
MRISVGVLSAPPQALRKAVRRNRKVIKGRFLDIAGNLSTNKSSKDGSIIIVSWKSGTSLYIFTSLLRIRSSIA